MKKKRLLYLIFPVITIILEILPYGAVCNFANPEGEPWRSTYSYFSLTPFGYANFAPFLTALCTCAVFVLLSIYLFAANEALLRRTKIVNIVALALSLCPLLYGISYYSVVGGLITLSLLAELILLCLWREKNAEKERCM